MLDGFALGIVSREDGLAVLVATATSTAVVGAPEDTQEFLVAGDLRIVVDGECFGVITDGAVGGLGRGPAAVADACPYDARNDSELGIGSPESAEAEGGGFEGSFGVLDIEREDPGGGNPVFEGEWLVGLEA